MTAAPVVALYSGLIVEADAISASLRAKLAALRSAREKGLDVEVVAFCQHSNVEDPAIEVASGGVSDLVGRRNFRRASLHIFEFGIYYQLFNVAHLLAPERMAAIYHNITPRHLIADPIAQAAVDRSMLQKHLLARMSHVVCISEYSQQDLVEFGIPPDRLSVLPLPGSFSGQAPPPRALRSSSEPIRFLFVGRLVRAKGVLDLLAATSRLVDDGESDFEVLLAGRIDFSDTETTEGISAALESSTVARFVRFMPNAPSEDIGLAYQNADVFVMPSYHEGYCVPIVEAFRAACPVIAYNNSNIPLVSGGLADLVATGDVEGLAESMRRAMHSLRTARSGGSPYLVLTSRGALSEPEWRVAALGRVEGIDNAHDDGFIALVRELLTPGHRQRQPGWKHANRHSRQTAHAMPT
jgi:glycosyltransferase involved in cell wall biosynthesis